MRNHVLLRSVGLGALLLAVGSSASAEKIDRRFHRVFDVQKGAQLVLHHGDGEVSITPWEKSAIDVEGRIGQDYRLRCRVRPEW
jgi:hypothetical protein